MDADISETSDSLPILRPEDFGVLSPDSDAQVGPENTGFDPYDTASLFIPKVRPEED